MTIVTIQFETADDQYDDDEFEEAMDSLAAWMDDLTDERGSEFAFFIVLSMAHAIAMSMSETTH
jgi:hypothetical protein